MLSEKTKSKIKNYLEVFNENFYVHGNFREKGVGVPIEYITYKNGEPQFGYSGDGTINLSQMLQLTFSKYLAAKGTELESEFAYSLGQQLYIMFRLEESAKDACGFGDELTTVKGFFIRDDISYEQRLDMGLNDLMTSYGQAKEGINIDVCQSPFVSQDQIWNLIPILKRIGDENITEGSVSVVAKIIAEDMLKYVVDNNHVIYNPYYSRHLHNWTYCKLGTPFKDRIEDRDANFKNTVKVKRGAYNWYFAYGFRKSYENFSGKKLSKLKNFLWSMIYIPILFLADVVYHEHICKWFKLPIKQNSYYSLAYTSGVWYSPFYKKRLNNKFLKSLEESVVDGKVVKELFMPHLFFIVNKDFASTSFKHRDKVMSGLTKYLEALPEFTGEGYFFNQSMNIALFEYLQIMEKAN